MTHKPDKTTLIVGINLGLLVGYTLSLRLVNPGNFNFISLFWIIILHFATCLVLAVVGNEKGFLLSALALLLIGFSTCVIGLGK
jgi:hypothetical protein